MDVRFYFSLIQLLGVQRLYVSCLAMKMVLKIYKGAGFYAPTQVVLLFAEDALFGMLTTILYVTFVHPLLSC